MGLADFLFSPRQQRLLGRLLLNPGRSYSLTDVLASSGAGRGGTQVFVQRLLDAGVLIDEPLGRQRRLRINEGFPLYPELRSICLKSFGLGEQLRDALAPFAGGIEEAFVFGSVAGGTDTAGSDIDLMVVGSAELIPLLEALAPLEATLGRPLHLTLYAASEWQALQKSDPVVRQICDGPRIEVFPNVTAR